jgi:ACS family tartrate transporter-like MFS transporter
MDPAWQKAVLKKTAWRLIPFLFLLYVVNILDRINIAVASLEMIPDPLSEQAYSLGSGIFYVGYLLFELPSNLILRRLGARRWISRIMISWGLVTSAMMFVDGPWGFYLLRILLGFAEAGFFPGIIFYLTYWVPARERAKMMAGFMVALPLTGILGSPLSAAILDAMSGVGDLKGWQWVFLLEGVPAILLGVAVLFYLPDVPGQASWLEPREREWLKEETGREEEYRRKVHGLTLRQALADVRVWHLICLYFTIAVGANAIGFYLPRLVAIAFPAAKKYQIGLLAAVPNVGAALGMLTNSWHSDRTGERRWHVAVPGYVCALGWLLAAFGPSSAVIFIGLILAQATVSSMIPVFWSMPTRFLSGAAAAGGIALINSVANLGGFAGPYLLGLSKSWTDSFAAGMGLIAAVMALGGILALAVRRSINDSDGSP